MRVGDGSKDSYHDEPGEKRALALLKGQTASEDIASRLTLKCNPGALGST
jgi:hypothetical protein